MSSVPLQGTRSKLKEGFTNILLATDFSPCSQAAVPYAAGIARVHGSTVHLLHVLDAEPTPGHFIPDVDFRENTTAAECKMAELAGLDELKGIRHTQSLKSGVVWDVVSEYIRDFGIDLVIVGTHSGDGLRHVVLGSVAEKILRHATCPVLSVRPENRNRGLADGKVETILCATDLSAASEGAVESSLNFVRATNAKLILLHALDDRGETAGNELDREIEEAERRLSNIVEACSDVCCRAIVDCGATAADVILRKAEQFSADMIVMGARAGTAAAHVPWTVVHQVISHALCPVMTVGQWISVRT